jgi:hypothetical protein
MLKKSSINQISRYLFKIAITSKKNQNDLWRKIKIKQILNNKIK